MDLTTKQMEQIMEIIIRPNTPAERAYDGEYKKLNNALELVNAAINQIDHLDMPEIEQLERLADDLEVRLEDMSFSENIAK